MSLHFIQKLNETINCSLVFIDRVMQATQYNQPRVSWLVHTYVHFCQPVIQWASDKETRFGSIPTHGNTQVLSKFDYNNCRSNNQQNTTNESRTQHNTAAKLIVV